MISDDDAMRLAIDEVNAMATVDFACDSIENGDFRVTSLEKRAKKLKLKFFQISAVTGEGVFETLRGMRWALPALRDAFRAALPEAVVYVYDNNSKDGTVLRARAAGAVVRRHRVTAWTPAMW